MVVAAATCLLYLVLFGLVHRGSQTIEAQRGELKSRVAELSTLLARNLQLDAKVRGAAARATAANERFLRRISGDLHDGPGQDMGFALMRIETMVNRYLEEQGALVPAAALSADLGAIRLALESALAELRSISAGLQLPQLSDLSTREIAARAVRDFESKTGRTVDITATGDAANVSLPVKITLYRLLQESLANGYRHADAIDLRVALAHSDSNLHIEVSDGGGGFDVKAKALDGGLGLTGMRERVEALGGTFELDAALGKRTHIRAKIPLRVPGAGDE